MSIVIVRHGETDLNAAKVVQLADTPLSARGRAQAERVAARLARLGVGGIVSSDFTRAMMTADAIAAATGVAVEHDALLRERDFGAIRGIAYGDLTEDVFAPDYVPPEGESWPAFRERVAGAWDAVVRRAAATPGNLVVVTHGLVCHTLFAAHVRCADAAPASWGNTSVTEIEATPPWRVRVLNCVAHLEAERDGHEPPQGRV